MTETLPFGTGSSQWKEEQLLIAILASHFSLQLRKLCYHPILESISHKHKYSLIATFCLWYFYNILWSALSSPCCHSSCSSFSGDNKISFFFIQLLGWISSSTLETTSIFYPYFQCKHLWLTASIKFYKILVWKAIQYSNSIAIRMTTAAFDVV